MHKKSKSIPINALANEYGMGISIERVSFPGPDNADNAALGPEATQAHRHDGHSFFLLEKGTIDIEIDFENYLIRSPSVIYIHPDQVHRTMLVENVTVSSWAVDNENLNPEYFKLLEDIRPAKPIMLTTQTFNLIAEAVALSLKFFERRNDKLYHSLLKDSCNALTALVLSQYLELVKPAGQLSRFDVLSKAFRQKLERDYATANRPADYAKSLNISTPYLNECVKNATGHSVSHHIQQRVILEAKRLLVHSDKSIKEIASELSYDDYPYFSRLFTKVAGMSALTFRNKNRV